MRKILPYELLNLEALWCSTQIIATIIKPTDMLRQMFGGCLLFIGKSLTMWHVVPGAFNW